MKFYSSFDVAKCEPAPTGNGKMPEYKEKMVKGLKTLVCVGERDLQEEIQASRDSVDLNYLILKYQDTSDPSVLNRVSTFYGDFSKVPKDIFEAQQMMFDGQESFDSMSREIKELFHNDVYRFMNDENALKKIEDYYAAKMKANSVYKDFKIDKSKYSFGEDVKEEVKKDE